jgi:hypothetical protein
MVEKDSAGSQPGSTARREIRGAALRFLSNRGHGVWRVPFHLHPPFSMHPLLRVPAVLFLAAFAAFAEPAYKVEVDYSAAPECEPFALKAKAIAQEWYPKINEILFGKGHPLPVATVRLKFEPMKGVAHATHDGIHISAEWVTKKAPNDYGMVVHELTHVVQAYRGKGEGWLTEGIADYVRYERYEPGKQKWKLDPEKSSYKQGYGIAGAFLAWLEKNKNPDVIRKLNVACREGTYRRDLFHELCGGDVDTLWKEFIASQPQ